MGLREARPGAARLSVPVRVLIFIWGYLLVMFLVHWGIVFLLWRISGDELAFWRVLHWFFDGPFRGGVEALPAVVWVEVFRRRIDRRSVGSLGLNWNRAAWGDLAFGLALGALLITGVLGMLVLTGRMQWRGWAIPEGQPWWGVGGPWGFQAVVMGGACLGVEWVTRGYLLRNLALELGPEAAVLGAAVLGILLQYPCPWLAISPPLGESFYFSEGTSLPFVAFQVWFTPPLSGLGLCNLVLAGILMGELCLLTGSLWASVGAHWAWWSLPGLLFGLPADGLQGFNHWMKVRLAGDPLLTGGGFGPGGGLYATVALLAGLCWVLGRGWGGGKDPCSPFRRSLPPAD